VRSELWRGDALKVSKHPSERAEVIHTFGVGATITIVPSNLGILVSGLFLGERFFLQGAGRSVLNLFAAPKLVLVSSLQDRLKLSSRAFAGLMPFTTRRLDGAER
jgi:hypothetical protein